MTIARIVVAGLLAALPIFVTAQEGFPLDGTWRGAYGPAGADASPVVLVMKWNGAGIDGLINPGRNSVAFAAAELDARDWTVRIEADMPDSSGVPARVLIEGTLENLGSYHRTITGTWAQGGVQMPFKIARE